MTTTIFNLIRHGETDWNVRGLYQGTSDIPLNETGRRQAIELGDAMQGEQWDLIVSSPSQRAMDTAREVARGIGASADDIVPDPRVMERGYGEAEGMTLAEREQVWPEGEWPGLEDWEAVAIRGMEALYDYAESHAGQRIVIVAHGGLINSILATISDGEMGTGKTEIRNTSRSELMWDGETWTWGDIAVVDHLSAAAR